MNYHTSGRPLSEVIEQDLGYEKDTLLYRAEMLLHRVLSVVGNTGFEVDSRKWFVEASDAMRTVSRFRAEFDRLSPPEFHISFTQKQLEAFLQSEGVDTSSLFPYDGIGWDGVPVQHLVGMVGVHPIIAAVVGYWQAVERLEPYLSFYYAMQNNQAYQVGEHVPAIKLQKASAYHTQADINEMYGTWAFEKDQDGERPCKQFIPHRRSYVRKHRSPHPDPVFGCLPLDQQTYQLAYYTANWGSPAKDWGSFFKVPEGKVVLEVSTAVEHSNLPFDYFFAYTLGHEKGASAWYNLFADYTTIQNVYAVLMHEFEGLNVTDYSESVTLSIFDLDMAHARFKDAFVPGNDNFEQVYAHLKYKSSLGGRLYNEVVAFNKRYKQELYKYVASDSSDSKDRQLSDSVEQRKEHARLLFPYHMIQEGFELAYYREGVWGFYLPYTEVEKWSYHPIEYHRFENKLDRAVRKSVPKGWKAFALNWRVTGSYERNDWRGVLE